MPVSEARYRQVALEDPEGKWELVCGHLIAKPAMTTEHEQVARKLARQLILQLSDEEYLVDRDSPRLRVHGGNYRLPDVCVIPVPVIQQRLREYPAKLEEYEEPMPLVVEVWSPSTGDYDVDTKIPEYQRRGDLEIWRIHPYDRTLTARRRQPDGSYTESMHTTGTIHPAALPQRHNRYRPSLRLIPSEEDES